MRRVRFSIEVFDLGNNLLTSFLGDNTNHNFSFANPNIHRVVMTPLAGSLDGLDSLEFGVLAVPEPRSLGLLAAAIIALAPTRRRSKK